MREAVAADRLRHLLDDSGRDRLLEDLEEPFRFEIGDPLERVEAELPAHDRGGRQELRARLAQAAEPPADHVAHALRQTQVRDPRPAPPLGPLAPPAALA